MTKSKLLYYISTAISVVSIALSILQSVRPEWFAWLITASGMTPEALQALFTVLGYGGLTGTGGFAIIQSALVKMEQKTVEHDTKAQQQVAVVVGELIGAYKTVSSKVDNFEHKLEGTTQEMKNFYTDTRKEVYQAVDLTKKAADLYIVNANRSLNNPFVSDEDKAKIKEAVNKYVNSILDENSQL